MEKELDAFAMAMQGLLNYGFGNTNEAIDLIKKSIEIYPYDSEIHFHLGIIYFELDLLNDSLLYFKRAVILDNNNSEAHEYIKKINNYLAN